MNCLQCQKETKNHKFCSRSCATTWNNKNIIKNKMKGKCKTCQTPIPSQRVYCRPCFIIRPTQTQLIGDRQVRVRPIARNNLCQHCQQPANKTYCSPRCATDAKFYKRVQDVETSGIIYPNTKFSTSSVFAKHYLKYKYGNKCAICLQETIWNNQPLTLILDHIDGKPNNWTITNLRLVCPNCDSQLSTYKAKNKGNGGRPNRHSCFVSDL